MKPFSLYREKLWVQVMIPVSAVVAIVIAEKLLSMLRVWLY